MRIFSIQFKFHDDKYSKYLYVLLLVENPIKTEEVSPADNVEVKVTVKEEESVNLGTTTVKKTRNASKPKAKPTALKLSKPPKAPKTSWKSSSATKPDPDYSEDIKDIQPDRNSFDDNIAHPVTVPVNKGFLKIESVFIDDDSPYAQPHEIETISIDDVKKENESDDDFWANEKYDDSSDEPFKIVKCESLGDEEKTKKAAKSTTMPRKVVENNDIKSEQLNTSIKEDDNEDDEMDSPDEESPLPPKPAAPKTEMERCIPCKRKFHDIVKHWVQYHSGLERPYECFVCHKDYKRFEHLKYHMKTHGNERNYICHVCGDAFFLSNELRKHIMNRHQVERPFKCTFQQCKKCFKNQHALNVHMRTHSGVKPFVCAVCSEAFAAMSSLKIHERKHTGAKPYVCKFCKKAFADCSTHRQHVRIHTGEKPYRCHLCDRRTAQAGNLKSHYRHYHKIIVKSVSMYVDHNASTIPFVPEIQRDPYERNHEFASYPLMDPSRRIEE